MKIWLQLRLQTNLQIEIILKIQQEVEPVRVQESKAFKLLEKYRRQRQMRRNSKLRSGKDRPNSNLMLKLKKLLK